MDSEASDEGYKFKKSRYKGSRESKTELLIDLMGL